ncbi:MAG: asparagine synthase (glutamine-hydrolyzing) [Flavobacteriales bacterium]|nr:asparagine synthase (glutamine-hydrolyzing) [Flavobacteriales bacterium]
MCGICGLIDFDNGSNLEQLTQMNATLTHRGPDAEGHFFEEIGSVQVGLGHKRLSIIDLSNHANQPMHSEDKKWAIVFNGEVYNFHEIRKELEALGETFTTQSDTEVVLKSWRKWGEKAVDRFIGMFAFAILDKTTQKLVLVRDRAGVKPLYYFHKNGVFLFGSELKALMAHPKFERVIDPDTTALYMKYGYYPEPHTVFKNCFKLPAASILEVDIKTNTSRVEAYWSPFRNIEKPSEFSEGETLERVENLLVDSFKYRMVSDVPVGVFLSGGYDSTAVTALLQKQSNQPLNTFTIGFDEKGFNEAPFASVIANRLGTNHTEEYCTHQDAQQVIPELGEIYCEPFGDSSAIPTILVSRMAKKHVKVALSADGGDELFAGYGKYKTTKKYLDMLASLPLPKVISSVMGSIKPIVPFSMLGYNAKRRYSKVEEMLASALSSTMVMKLNSAVLVPQELKKLVLNSAYELKTNFDLTSNCGHKFEDNLMLATDYKTYMVDDILTKVDRATMSVGLEGREPMLDHRLAEFLATVPYSLKTKNEDPKYLLKTIVHKYVPKEMMDRPKMGFAVPVEKWMKDELVEMLEETLSFSAIKDAGVFNPNEVENLKRSYLNGKEEDFRAVWFLFVFQLWYNQWMK